jgi:hypothetical protein
MVVGNVMGTYAYFRMARAGTEGSTLVSLSMLYSVVPVLIGIMLGDVIRTIPAIGIVIVVASCVALSRELVLSKKSSGPALQHAADDPNSKSARMSSTTSTNANASILAMM